MRPKACYSVHHNSFFPMQIHSRYSLADLYFDILVENLSLQVQDIQGITELITNCLDIINKVQRQKLNSFVHILFIIIIVVTLTNLNFSIMHYTTTILLNCIAVYRLKKMMMLLNV